MLSAGAKLTEDDVERLANYCMINTVQHVLKHYAMPADSKISVIHAVVERRAYMRSVQLTSLRVSDSCVYYRLRMWEGNVFILCVCVCVCVSVCVCICLCVC